MWPYLYHGSTPLADLSMLNRSVIAVDNDHHKPSGIDVAPSRSESCEAIHAADEEPPEVLTVKSMGNHVRSVYMVYRWYSANRGIVVDRVIPLTHQFFLHKASMSMPLSHSCESCFHSSYIIRYHVCHSVGSQYRKSCLQPLVSSDMSSSISVSWMTLGRPVNLQGLYTYPGYPAIPGPALQKRLAISPYLSLIMPFFHLFSHPLVIPLSLLIPLSL